MSDLDVNHTVAAALHEQAQGITTVPPSVSAIRSRAGRRRVRRRRRRTLLVITAVMTVAAGTLAYRVGRRHSSVTVATGPAHQSLKSTPAGAALADTTAGQRCPVANNHPSAPATTIAQVAPKSLVVVVPSSVPAGLCVVVASSVQPNQGEFELTALADCASCVDPGAAVSISRSSKRDTWDDGPTAGEETGSVAGQTYAYKPPSTQNARAMLAVPADPRNNAGFVLIGFGLSKNQYLNLATELTSKSQPDLPGLQTVYDGPADSNDGIVPGDLNTYTYLSWLAPDGNTLLTYTYQAGPNVPPPAAYAWQYPKAKATGTAGPTAVVAMVANGYDVLSEPRSRALVTVQYRSTEPTLDPSPLAGIADDLSTLSSTTTSWTALEAAAQTHLDNPNPALLP